MGLERICKVPPGSPLFDHSLLCFMNMSRAHIDLVSDGKHIPVAKKVVSRVQRRCNSSSFKSSLATELTSAKCTGEIDKVHIQNENATLAEKPFKRKRMKNVDAIIDTPEILDILESDDGYYILIENLEKDLEALTIMSFLLNYVTIMSEAFVFPSLPSDSSTRGIIFVETKDRLTKLMMFLRDPDQLIVSARGRPWVISDPQPRGGAFGNLWSKTEVLKGSDLMVVTKGTKEFKKREELLEIFTNSVMRIQDIHENVISEEENVLLRYDTWSSTKKLKGAAEHKLMKF